MADMPSDFWSGWTVVITAVSLAGLAWLVFSIYFTPKREQHVSPVWDETLIEGDSPAPMWWFWLIFMAMIFSVVYLMLYPGMGSYKGALKWSQGGRLGESYALHDYEFGAARQRLLGESLESMQNNASAMRSAQGIFSRNCAACHGPMGQGQAQMFPNLSDKAWQWGASPDEIEHSIRFGRQAAMPAWAAILGEDGTSNVTDYLLAGEHAAPDHPGVTAFQNFCQACHGPDGKGNPAMGAPDLTDQDWLYGSSREQISHSIAQGRNGQMPAFGENLDDLQIRLLVAWLTRDGP